MNDPMTREEMWTKWGRAESPELKKQIMARLLDLWCREPDLRLGQLIGNVMEDRDLYICEDLPLVRLLETYYLKFGKESRVNPS